jgi:dihydroxy-acid dehydratase
MELRSNFEAGTSRWATRRALGLSDEDMAKPKIAVVNSPSDLAICYSHLDEIARKAKEAIRAAGWIGFEVRTTAPSDFIHSAGSRGGYILASRDLIVNDIAAGVEGDARRRLCLTSCDKTAPAQLMAAGRLNIPTIVVACGYQRSGTFRGERYDIEDVFLAAGHVAPGRLGIDDLTEMSENAVPGPGVCGMGTANSMPIVCEALGMALPCSTPVAANSSAMWDAVVDADERIVQMVARGSSPVTC